MKYIYYCNSAYQLVLTLNLHWQRKKEGFENLQDYDADIIILNAFKGAEDIVAMLNENKVFEHAYLVGKKFNSGIFHVISTVLDVVFPSRYLKKHGFNKNDVKGRYDAIVVPKYNQIMAAIWQVNRNAQLHLIEDGLGSYYMDMDLRSRSKVYRMLYKTVNYGKEFTNFDRIYLNQPILFRGKQKDKVRKIPVINSECKSVYSGMFADFINEKDNEKSIYWFGQYFVQDDINQACEESVDVLRDYSSNVLFCPHPRHPHAAEGFDLCSEKRLWEFQLLSMDDVEEKCFSTFHSTACLSPKLLYDQEPYIIFAYPFVTENNIAKHDDFYDFMENFKSSYRNPDKIMLPKNSVEFKEAIDRFLESAKH